MSLQKTLRKDEHFVRYLNVLETVRSSLRIEAIMKEASLLHKGRKSRVLYEARVSPARLQDAILLDLSNRSRLVELQVTMMNQEELLSTTIKAVRKYVRVQYAEEIRGYGGTAAQQTAVLDRIFSEGAEVKEQIEGAIARLLVYIKDIDQAGYGLTGARDTLRMVLDRREGSM